MIFNDSGVCEQEYKMHSHFKSVIQSQRCLCTCIFTPAFAQTPSKITSCTLSVQNLQSCLLFSATSLAYIYIWGVYIYVYTPQIPHFLLSAPSAAVLRLEVDNVRP